MAECTCKRIGVNAWECDPNCSVHGDHAQPLPQPNDGPSMHDLVIEDIRARKDFGLRKYGTTLQAHNGRDALRDAYEEILDLIVYIRQELEERDSQSTQS